VERPGEAVVARSLVARAELACGERAAAERSVIALRERITPDSLSARSSTAIREIAATLGILVPEIKGE
jgi:hypothetical protein